MQIQIGHFDLENLEEGIAYYRNYYKEIRDEKTLAYEGVEPLLRILKQRGYQMGILSNKGPDGLAHGLDKFGYNELDLNRCGLSLQSIY